MDTYQKEQICGRQQWKLMVQFSWLFTENITEVITRDCTPWSIFPIESRHTCELPSVFLSNYPLTACRSTLSGSLPQEDRWTKQWNGDRCLICSGSSQSTRKNQPTTTKKTSNTHQATLHFSLINDQLIWASLEPSCSWESSCILEGPLLPKQVVCGGFWVLQDQCHKRWGQQQQFQ